MKKKDIKYPIELVVSLLCDKWKFIILCKLRKDKKRFTELQKEIGDISAKVLTSQLKELENTKFIKREVYSDEVPIKVEYSLTDLGQSLYPVMKAMFDWGMDNKDSFTQQYNINIDDKLIFPK
ncbi:helix-turn-helix transcriptional regulator [Clostridium botulinum]|nr:helix-turn-helix transcriptional regulator [Clostridium botulinum]NFH89653.1 helix-turn-helix transcriptional regulator [Clostridium botulinum]NFI16856.1 helix-turn-helix transcriptional regulator [Clostridium botulinum]NFI54382.1 helix-turn-helix transcriptional regulator [Clostridium botulinum]NFL91570.1 helix-turn-helix transcriptional regulator [Clostridium botulinum]